MDAYDVLVVGAGPTGLMMASELKRYGLTCKIIDKNASPSKQSKALAIQPRTLEIFHILGLSQKFLERGQKIQGLNALSRKKRIGHIDLTALDSSFPFLLSLPQSVTEEILNAHLENLHGHVEREVELTKIEKEKKGIIAHLVGPTQETQKIQARWIIGCDGAHSFVRKYLNLSFQGKAIPEVFSLADVEVRWRYPHQEGCVFFQREGVLVAIPFEKEHRYRLIFQLPRCQSSKETDTTNSQLPPPTEKEVQKIVQKLADTKAEISHSRWLANFHVHSRLTEAYRVGSFFLAGDAAHVHSPIGGQGMNTGLQDAFNLAWKLALVHKGVLSSQLLDSYHFERHNVAEHLLQGTEAGTHIATLHKPWKISLRNWIGSFLLNLSLVQKKLIHAVAQLSICYPKSFLVNEVGKFHKKVKVGMRIPNVLGHLQNKEIRLFDLLQNPKTFFLFLFAGHAHTIEELKLLVKQLSPLSVPVHVFYISLESSEEPQVLFDQKGKMHHMFGCKEGGAYVVRPDTYIGYRQTPINFEKLLYYFNPFSL